MQERTIPRTFFITRIFECCTPALCVLLFLASQANAVVLVRDQTLEFEMPASFEADNYRPSIFARTGIYDMQPNPMTNRLESRLRTGATHYSTSGPISENYDLATLLAGQAVGTVASNAGNGESSISMSLSNVDILPSVYGTTFSTTIGEFEQVRFAAPTDRLVEVEASYQLSGSVMGPPGSLVSASRAYGVFYLLDLESYHPDPSGQDSFIGEAQIPLLDVSEPGEVYVPQIVNVWTNRAYFVASGVVLGVTIDSAFQSVADISLQANATSPTFFTSDSSISIERSTLARHPTPVAEPSVVGLLGLGFIVLLWRRLAINLS